MTAAQICLALLGLTVGLLLYAEFNRRTDGARIAAILSIVTIIATDYFFIRAMPSGTGWEFAQASTHEPKAALERRASAGSAGQGAPARAVGGDQGEGEVPQAEPASATGEDTLPEGDDEASGAGTSAREKLDDMGRSFTHWLRSLFAWPDERSTALSRLHEFRDCDNCPEMVRIPAGSRAIGAGDNDLLADPAERPLRTYKAWPGFAVSRFEITIADMDAAGLKIEARGA